MIVRESALTILDPHTTASATLLRDRFASAAPFKHVLIDGFFTEELARALVEQFPKPDDSISLNPYGAAGAKATRPDLSALGSAYRSVHAGLGSPAFLGWLGEVTGITGLIYDEHHFGGGTHENFEGRDLRPHVDFNYHPVTKLHRRINLIVYLNEEWRPEWGGAIALHSDPRGARNEVTEYQPLFNRCIIFETNERSWHGFERLTFPADQQMRSRKSLSIYLYTRERPEEEVHAEHTTFFIPRSLPARFAENRMLTASDVDELGELFGHRDRLIALYQREQGKRESDSAEAARLRILAAELQARQPLPIMGYVRQVGSVLGYYADGWSSGELRFSVHAERAVRSLTIRARIPEHLPDGSMLRIDLNGVCLAEKRVSSGVVAVSVDACIEAHEIGMMRITTSASINPKHAGIGEDERDLGFFLECATFEHTPERLALPPACINARIYMVIGDCHAARFDGLVLAPTENDDTPIVLKSRWQTYSRACDVFQNGFLNETITRVFIEMKLVRQSVKVVDSPFLPLSLPTKLGSYERMYFDLRPSGKNAVLLFTYGEVDMWDIADTYLGRYTFDVPDLPGLEYLPDTEQGLETLSQAMVEQLVSQRCAPLFNGLRALRDVGFTNISLHEIPSVGSRRPPRGATARLHHKLCAIFNRCYEAFCRAEGIGFVSIREDSTVDGLRDPRYDQDGIHLNRESALISIAHMRAQLKERGGR